MSLFETTGCIACHSGPNFSGASIFNQNTAYRIFPSITNQAYESKYNLTDDLGAATNREKLNSGIWRIPSLRNVSRTGPYFHNGSVNSLEEAVRIMARVQLNKNISNLESDDKRIKWSSQNNQLTVSGNHALSETEIKDIVAFLYSLNGDIPEN